MVRKTCGIYRVVLLCVVQCTVFTAWTDKYTISIVELCGVVVWSRDKYFLVIFHFGYFSYFSPSVSTRVHTCCCCKLY